MQARRRAQPSGTNSPSSSHPRLKHRARCVIFFRARHAAARVAPTRGTWQARIHEPRGSAPRERDHRGGDHPVPSRTRQLSPPSPRVLQREAAGGQGVALAEGAFLVARAARAEGPQGDRPLAGLFAFAGCRGLARRTRREGPQGDILCGPFRVQGSSRGSRGGAHRMRRSPAEKDPLCGAFCVLKSRSVYWMLGLSPCGCFGTMQVRGFGCYLIVYETWMVGGLYF